MECLLRLDELSKSLNKASDECHALDTLLRSGTLEEEELNNKVVQFEELMSMQNVEVSQMKVDIKEFYSEKEFLLLNMGEEERRKEQIENDIKEAIRQNKDLRITLLEMNTRFLSEINEVNSRGAHGLPSHSCLNDEDMKTAHRIQKLDAQIDRWVQKNAILEKQDKAMEKLQMSSAAKQQRLEESIFQLDKQLREMKGRQCSRRNTKDTDNALSLLSNHIVNHHHQ